MTQDPVTALSPVCELRKNRRVTGGLQAESTLNAPWPLSRQDACAPRKNSDQSGVLGAPDGFEASMRIQFAQNVLNVIVDGCAADVKLRSNT